MSAIFKPKRTALLPFMTAGLPTPDDSLTMFKAMAEAGADAFEVGIPYSDPLMDGPVIQRASSVALEAGTTLERSLGIISDVAKETGVPVLAMTYVNVVFRSGPDEFCRRLAAAGATGLIVPDMPVEEALEVRKAAEAHGLGMVLFVAPTSSSERIARVAALDPMFIYGVAEMGVTGERAESGGRAPEMAERIRSITDIPLVLGVGISTPAQAAAAGEVADGVIVGTALVRRVLDAPSPDKAAAALGEAVSDLRSAL